MKRLWGKLNQSRRIQTEDALKHVLDADESERGATVVSLAGSMGCSQRVAAEILGRMRAQGLLTSATDVHHLTEEGRSYALQVVRTHRLVETWLARETSTPAADWHRAAHKVEHQLEASDVDAMADRLNNPRFDPHGDPIPTREGQMPKRALTALPSWPVGESASIEHIEDEPAMLFRQAEMLGFSPGTRIDDTCLLNDGSIEAQVDGRRVIIPAAVATLIHVTNPADDDRPEGLTRLSDLPVAGEAVVHGLAPSCTGAERRRLLDLGVVPGTRIRCEFTSPFGSPRSYDIRGALIALRDHQADRILIHSTTTERL